MKSSEPVVGPQITSMYGCRGRRRIGRNVDVGQLCTGRCTVPVKSTSLYASSCVETLTINLIATHSQTGSCKRQRTRDTSALAVEVCATPVMGIHKAPEEEVRGLLSRSTLDVYICCVSGRGVEQGRERECT